MDRELLIEIGCEEIPAGWLPGLTRQIGGHRLEQVCAHEIHDACHADERLRWALRVRIGQSKEP